MTEEKKGVAIKDWQFASSEKSIDTPDGFQPRWCRNEPDNIAKKKSEGWEFLNKITSPSTTVKTEGSETVSDASNVTGSLTNREMVAMALPIEDIYGNGQCLVNRRKAIAELTRKQRDAKIQAKDAKKELGSYGDHIFEGTLTRE